MKKKELQNKVDKLNKISGAKPKKGFSAHDSVGVWYLEEHGFNDQTFDLCANVNEKGNQHIANKKPLSAKEMSVFLDGALLGTIKIK